MIAPPLSAFARPLWHLWMDLHASRSYGMGAPQGVSYGELDAYARVRRRPWSRFELDAVRAVDRAYLAVQADDGPGVSGESTPVLPEAAAPSDGSTPPASPAAPVRADVLLAQRLGT